MRVGVVILPQFDLPETQARWKALQDMGFAHGWTYDHLAWRDLADEPWFATVPTLTVAALATSTLRLGTWVTSPNFRHPVTHAKDLMTLDVLSGGRVIAALGAGGLGWDSAVLGSAELSPGQRVSRLEEFVVLSDRLLRNQVTTWRGEWYSAVEARMIPGCVQHPRLPLVIASNGPRGIRMAAQLATGPADGWATTGPDADTQDGWWAGVKRSVEVLDEARDGRPIDRYLALDSATLFSLSSVQAFIDAAGRAAELGFTDVITHWPRRTKQYVGDAAELERVAALIGADGALEI